MTIADYASAAWLLLGVPGAARFGQANLDYDDADPVGTKLIVALAVMVGLILGPLSLHRSSEFKVTRR